MYAKEKYEEAVRAAEENEDLLDRLRDEVVTRFRDSPNARMDRDEWGNQGFDGDDSY